MTIKRTVSPFNSKKAMDRLSKPHERKGTKKARRNKAKEIPRTSLTRVAPSTLHPSCHLNQMSFRLVSLFLPPPSVLSFPHLVPSFLPSFLQLRLLRFDARLTFSLFSPCGGVVTFFFSSTKEDTIPTAQSSNRKNGMNTDRLSVPSRLRHTANETHKPESALIPSKQQSLSLPRCASRRTA